MNKGKSITMPKHMEISAVILGLNFDWTKLPHIFEEKLS